MSQDDPGPWMWEKAAQVLDRADRLQRHLFVLVHSTTRAVWEPPIDVFAKGDELWIVVALPGVDSGGIEVEVDEGYVRISGRRELPAVCATAEVHRLEIPIGRFARVLPIPAGRFEIVGKDSTQGCLVLRLKKTV